ncbi:hypothetical protein KY333_00740 [Candidatus Woesearchaeota archaeon]|nr:hypothetical protein [Candidatus Woesearchaeota archaeon]MBW2993801.1 hypothetical protein [Candidatus Woesearchaeota archaeon]
MKSKILFTFIVLILLSSTAFAVKENVKHEDKKGQSDLSKYAQHTAQGRVFTEEAKTQGYLAKTFSQMAEGEHVPEEYKEKWKGYAEEYAEGAAKAARKAGEEGKKAAQYEPTRERIWERKGYAFYDYLEAYDDYSGWNVYGSLYLGEETLAKRRQEAADYFCEKTLLLGGKACWQSRLCESYYYSHRPPAGQNILVAQAGVANYIPAITVQGEKSAPISYKEGGRSKTSWVYKLTYSITNPHQTALTYRIKLVGDEKTFESSAMTLSRSTETSWSNAARLESNPLIKESENDYHHVCLWFTPRITTLRANREEEICAPIIQYDGAATRPYETVSDEAVASITGANTTQPQGPEDPLKDA